MAATTIAATPSSEIVKLRAHRTPLMSPRPHTISNFGGRARPSLEDPSYRRLPTLHVASRSASRQHDKDNDRTMTHHRSKPVTDRRAQTQHIPPAWASVSIVTSAKIAAANFLNRRRYASVVHSQQPSSHRARLPQTARLEADNCCGALVVKKAAGLRASTARAPAYNQETTEFPSSGVPSAATPRRGSGSCRRRETRRRAIM
uniref:Uncharacterized protein n=1 Tax=Rhipicephalus zambeziensis TaxID=60191 RepID=A0A224YJX5_9ACAR